MLDWVGLDVELELGFTASDQADFIAHRIYLANRSKQVMPDEGWWVISGEVILDLLRRAHGGEDPDLLYAEAYANSHEQEDE